MEQKKQSQQPQPRYIRPEKTLCTNISHVIYALHVNWLKLVIHND